MGGVSAAKERQRQEAASKLGSHRLSVLEQARAAEAVLPCYQGFSLPPKASLADHGGKFCGRDPRCRLPCPKQHRASPSQAAQPKNQWRACALQAQPFRQGLPGKKGKSFSTRGWRPCRPSAMPASATQAKRARIGATKTKLHTIRTIMPIVRQKGRGTGDYRVTDGDRSTEKNFLPLSRRLVIGSGASIAVASKVTSISAFSGAPGTIVTMPCIRGKRAVLLARPKKGTVAETLLAEASRT